MVGAIHGAQDLTSVSYMPGKQYYCSGSRILTFLSPYFMPPYTVFSQFRLRNDTEEPHLEGSYANHYTTSSRSLI